MGDVKRVKSIQLYAGKIRKTCQCTGATGHQNTCFLTNCPESCSFNEASTSNNDSSALSPKCTSIFASNDRKAISGGFEPNNDMFPHSCSYQPADINSNLCEYRSVDQEINTKTCNEFNHDYTDSAFQNRIDYESNIRHEKTQCFNNNEAVNTRFCNNIMVRNESVGNTYEEECTCGDNQYGTKDSNQRNQTHVYTYTDNTSFYPGCDDQNPFNNASSSPPHTACDSTQVSNFIEPTETLAQSSSPQMINKGVQRTDRIKFCGVNENDACTCSAVIRNPIKSCKPGNDYSCYYQMGSGHDVNNHQGNILDAQLKEPRKKVKIKQRKYCLSVK